MAVAVAVPRDARLDALDEFIVRLRRLNYSPRTQIVYRATTARLLHAHPDIPLNAMTTGQIEEWLYGQGKSPRTFDVYLESIRPFFKRLKEQGVISANPCDGIKKPRVPVRARPSPSLGDFRRLLAACQTPEETVLLTTLYYTGLRLTEVRLCRVGDVRLDERVIHVIGKGSK